MHSAPQKVPAMGKHLAFRNVLSLYDAIRATVGAAPEHINPVGVTRFSTSGKPSNTDGWVIPSDNGVFRFGCWRQGVSGFWSESRAVVQVTQTALMARQRMMSQVDQGRRERARINAAMWGRAHPVLAASPSGRYLLNRGLELHDYPTSLRMAHMKYYDDGVDHGQVAVMLGAVTDQDGSLVALHRTFLSSDGQKAAVPHPKKLTCTSAPLAGAAIKLYPPRIINGKLTLAVSEGIETALACFLGSTIPTWSCVSANGLKTFLWPIGLESLVIFSDNDASGVGQSAARALAARATAAGLEVRVMVPPTPGTDWLDIHTGAAK